MILFIENSRKGKTLGSETSPMVAKSQEGGTFGTWLWYGYMIISICQNALNCAV